MEVILLNFIPLAELIIASLAKKRPHLHKTILLFIAAEGILMAIYVSNLVGFLKIYI